MPHLDTLSLRTSRNHRGQSPFARPVAAITAFVRRRLAKSRQVPSRAAQDLEMLALEEKLGQASDVADLERMQRAYDRRDAGGVRAWDWR
jgi:hypothetical protein